MVSSYDAFYLHVLRKLLASGQISQSDRILVVCGGTADRNCLQEAGFSQAVISNLDTRMGADTAKPFEWSFQNTESLDFADETFDVVIEQNGLHHCHSPHKALLEMYRVAKKAVLFFEPADNWITRLGVRIGLGQRWEFASVMANGFQYGGVANSSVPNFIYRWTTRDIEKTLDCYAPYGRHEYRYFHALRMPWGQLRARKNRLIPLLATAAVPLLKLAELVWPSCANCFAAFIQKPSTFHPWIQPGPYGKPTVNEEAMRASFNAEIPK